MDSNGPATTLYAGTAGASSDASGFQGIYKSTDGGVTWAAINKGLESILGNHLTTATTLVVDPANRSVLYFGTSNAGVFRSTDGGATWSPLNDGLTDLELGPSLWLASRTTPCMWRRAAASSRSPIGSADVAHWFSGARRRSSSKKFSSITTS